MTRHTDRKMCEYAMNKVWVKTAKLFDYCGVRFDNIKELTMDDWQKVLDCRHGDEQLEALFVELEEARAYKNECYARLPKR